MNKLHPQRENRPLISLLRERIKGLKARYADHPNVKKSISYFRKGLLAFIIALIIYNLYKIGWNEVLQSLPGQPLFYVLFIILYLTLPIAEVMVYRQVWPLKKFDLFKTMIIKKVYNEEVMGYSGELHLFTWGRKQLDKKDLNILADIRDNSILSSITSNIVAFLLVGLLLFLGILDPDIFFDHLNILYLLFFLVLFVIVGALLFQFRKYLFSLSLKKASLIFSIYFSRFILHHGLLILQWSIVFPLIPINEWFLLVALIIIINRIPFIPSRDLVFLWAGIELSRYLTVSTAGVAGMLLVTSALKKGSNLLLFLIISYYSKDPVPVNKE
ncbi:hypothetical protein QLX67_01050 [Balneolaceae bacterium ANBcel3]|nr:hypothetical protein [Balneolaceae bacterium ANBcel3]